MTDSTIECAAAPSIRLFYALWPDEATQTALIRLQAHIQGRKTPRENLHITLAFLGGQPRDRLPVLAQILHSLAPANLVLELNRLGYFRRKRIAWAGMHVLPDPLISLHRTLTEALILHGIDFDSTSTFRPHVTLARDAAAPDEMPFETVAWRTSRIALIESVTLPEGPLYRTVAGSDPYTA